MSKDELDFEFTVKELDQMVLDAARGDERIEGGKGKSVRPNFLEMLKAKSGLNKVRNGNQS